MTVAELLYGSLCSQDPERSEREVRRFVESFASFRSGARRLPRIRVRYGLRRKTIGPNDLVIAATALATKATVITANVREFARVDGLVVENWR
jgi:tRNA(fMet)-specific endonuclease VapC